MRRPSAMRSGFSLLEVLIAMFILLLGITSILVLFPVGVMRIAKAVVDTRCTLTAQAMADSANLHNMFNDPLHLWPRPNVPPAAPPNFLQATSNFNTALPPPGFDQSSYYLNIPNLDANDEELTPPTAAERLTAGPAGLPLIVDPLWVHSRYETGAPSLTTNDDNWQTSRQTAIDFSTLVSSGLVAAAPAVRPVRVVTTWEAASIENAAIRGAYVNRWFTSAGDVEYREEMAAMPHSPADPVGPATIYDPGTAALPLAGTASTSSRNRPYSWSLMFRRDVDALLVPGQSTRRALLVFYKRSLVNPYTVAAACFFNGDNRVTLRYPNPVAPAPAEAQRPRIRKGTWLCEMTVKGTGSYDDVDPFSANRRSFNFHRVADFEEQVDPLAAAGTGSTIFVITLSKNPSGYNPAPVLPAVRSFPDAALANGGPEHFPVAILDGLQEVFDLTIDGVWDKN